LKDVSELVKAGIITQETAEKIVEYYRLKNAQGPNRLFIVFGILGSILVGLGIILIIAHNWDDLSKTIKTIIAFFPLVFGQLICGYTLIKRSSSTGWREGSTTFLFFAVGAAISLISQIYNIPGDVSSFLFTWMLLCAPLIYIMNSSMASLLYIAGITYYACEAGYWSYPASEPYAYWLMLVIALPYYYLLYKRRPHSNFMIFHNWMIPISITIALGTLAENHEVLMFIAYFNLFGLFYIMGNTTFFQSQRSISNGYITIGSLGTIALLLTLSFDWFWEELMDENYLFTDLIYSVEFFISVILAILAIALLFQQKRDRISEVKPLEIVFILFIITFAIGLHSLLPVIIINLLVLGIGIMIIRDGARTDHLGIINFGLLIIAALVACRFFDENISFVIRGVLFVLVGVGFFLTNYLMIRKRRAA
jgi:uncharacterized membrane protein